MGLLYTEKWTKVRFIDQEIGNDVYCVKWIVEQEETWLNHFLGAIMLLGIIVCLVLLFVGFGGQY